MVHISKSDNKHIVHWYFSCSQDSDILGGDFDSVETSIPLIKRYYVNLYVFKFYNSDDVFFKCTVKLCPSGSSACDIVSKLKVNSMSALFYM